MYGVLVASYFVQSGAIFQKLISYQHPVGQILKGNLFITDLKVMM